MHLIPYVLAFVPMHHMSKAGALFALIGGIVAMILLAVLGPKRRYLVYLFALVAAAIFFLLIVPMLPPEWSRAR
jgi:hypothetical protein